MPIVLKKKAPEQTYPVPATPMASKNTELETPIRHTEFPPNCFLVTLVGDYYAYTNVSNQNTIKRYEISFVLPYSQFKKGPNWVRSICVRKLLDPAMRAKYPDYISYRTHVIKTCASLDHPDKPINDVQYMSEEQLDAYIHQNGLPVTVDLYPSVTEIRDAIILAQTDPEAHARNEERLEQRDPELSSGDVRELKGLNPEFDYAYYE